MITVMATTTGPSSWPVRTWNANSTVIPMNPEYGRTSCAQSIRRARPDTGEGAGSLGRIDNAMNSGPSAKPISPHGAAPCRPMVSK